VRENTVSHGTASSVRVGSLYSSGRDDYWSGWAESGGAEGIDHILSGGAASRYRNYSAMLTSPWIQLGSRNDAENISNIELVLARPLISGQGVKLSYRTDLSAAFTLIDTIDFTTYGGTQGEVIPFRLEVKGGIQIRAQLTTGFFVTTSPEVVKIILT